MAIAFDTISGKAQGNGTTVSTASFAIANVSNRLLLVGLVYQTGAGTITSIKWNTTETLTLLAGPLDITSGGTTEHLYVYGLLNPTATTATIDLVKSESGVYVTFYGLSYNGVKQSGLPDATATNTGSSSTPNCSVTTVADNCWVFNVMRQLTAGTTTAGANTTKRDPGTDIACDVGDTNAAQTPAGSKAQNWTSSSGVYGMINVSFAPYTVPSTNSGVAVFFQ